MATLPEGAGLQTALEFVDLPTNTFIIDWSCNQIRGMDAGLAAMRQAVEIILQNERFAWQIYSKNFGSELEGLPGNPFDFIQSELPRRVEDAFSVDSRITGVENYEFADLGGGRMLVSFDVMTVYGPISEEVTISNG